VESFEEKKIAQQYQRFGTIGSYALFADLYKEGIRQGVDTIERILKHLVIRALCVSVFSQFSSS